MFIFLFFVACSPQRINSHHDEIQSNYSNEASSQITIINVHQGDATLIQTDKGRRILIDTGNYFDEDRSLLKYLQTIGVYSLDAVFLTHFDLDHMGGILLFNTGLDENELTGDEIEIKAVYDRGLSDLQLNSFDNQYLEEFNQVRQEVYPGNQLIFDNVFITVLLVNGRSLKSSVTLNPDDENAHTAVYLVEVAGLKFLNMGDLPSKSDLETNHNNLDILVGETSGNVDFIHIGHHGSRYSTSQDLLDLTKPEVALLSVGNNNTYGHPTYEVLNRLQENSTDIYLTEKGNGATMTNTLIAEGNINLKIYVDGSWEITPPQRAFGAELFNNH